MRGNFTKSFLSLIAGLFIWPLFASAQQDSLDLQLDSLYEAAREAVIMATDSSDKVAIAISKIAIPIAIEVGDKKSEAGLNIMLCYSTENADLKAALTYMSRAIALFLEVKDTASAIDYMHYLGYKSARSGQFHQSLQWLQKSLELSEEQRDSSKIANSYSEFGYTYDRMERYEKAIQYHRQALVYSTTAKSKGLYLGRIGIAHDELGNYDSANFYNLGALTIFEENNFHNERYIWMNNVGNTYCKQNRWEEAVQIMEEGEQLGDAKEFVHTSNFYLNLGRAYLQTGQNEKSKNYLEQGLMLAKTQNILRSEQEGEYDIFLWYKQNNRLSEALQHYERHVQLKDSMYRLDKLKEVEALQLSFETERKDKELAENQVELTQKELEVKEANFRFLILGGILTFLGLIGIWFFRAQSIKRSRQAREFALQSEINRMENEKLIATEKLRISRDLHDNIGSQLTFMVSAADNLSFQAKHLESKEKLAAIGSFGRDAMKDLRHTIWAMEQSQGNIDILVSKLREMVNKIPPPPSVKIENEQDLTQPVQAAQMLNLFRIAQEAIQNAVKHAEASVITVRFSQESSDLKMQIQDDGKGFSSTSASSGHGLTNMRSRAASFGGNFAIDSSLNTGTTVTITVSLEKLNVI